MTTVRMMIVGAALLLPAAAHAQINPFATSRNAPRLTSEDLALMDQSADRLLATDDARPGAHETWSNPKTGAHGTVMLRGPMTRTVKGEKYACRALRYEVAVRGRAGERSYDVDWCRIPDGTWKLL